jgi:replicative DNA helicase
MGEEILVLPPQAAMAEQAALGAALITQEAARWVVSNMAARDFYAERNRLLYDAIVATIDDGLDVDIVTVSERLAHEGVLGDVGGPQYLQECQFVVGSAYSVEHYGKLVLRAEMDRQILKASLMVRDEMKRDEALARIATVCRARDMLDAKGGLSMADAMNRVLDELEKGPAKMLKLGLSNIDRLTGGSKPGDLITVGARTGTGKTAFLLSVALNMAREGRRVAFCAGEMAGEQVGMRALSAVSGVHHWKIRECRMTPSEQAAVARAASQLSELPIHFCTVPSPSLRDIKSFADSVRAEVVFVDYLTRCTLPRAESMRVSVNLFMVGLKNFARETSRLVVLAAQINRATDRVDVPPKLADLKESGAIEEESDGVILLHIGAEAKLADGKVPLQAAVAKNRHGKVGATDLLFDKDVMRIHGDISEIHDEEGGKLTQVGLLRVEDPIDKRQGVD